MNLKNNTRMRKTFMIMSALKEKSKDAEDAGLPVEALVSEVCLKFGAGRRYVKEIVQDLINTKKIQIVEKKAYYIGE